jgi:hypothetical protein
MEKYVTDNAWLRQWPKTVETAQEAFGGLIKVVSDMMQKNAEMRQQVSHLEHQLKIMEEQQHLEFQLQCNNVRFCDENLSQPEKWLSSNPCYKCRASTCNQICVCLVCCGRDDDEEGQLARESMWAEKDS